MNSDQARHGAPGSLGKAALQMTGGEIHGNATAIQNVEGNVTIVQHEPTLSPSQIDALLRPHLEHLIELCRFVPMRGIRREERRERGDPQRTAADPDQRLEPERIFVELDTTRRVRDPRAPKAAKTTRPVEPQEPKTRPLPALEAVAGGTPGHFVLHGAPGCGKSTFVRFLVLALAHNRLGQGEAWRSR